MKIEQYNRLQELAEKLTDVVISDADPDNWIGSGKIPGDLTQAERGDAYWCRKQANATLAVLTRVTTLVEIIQDQSSKGKGKTAGAGAVIEPEDDLDKAIKTAEKQASKLLEKAMAKNGEKKT